MRYIALIAAILMMAVLSSCETREQKKHKEFYFEKITEKALLYNDGVYPTDSLINRLRELRMERAKL